MTMSSTYFRSLVVAALAAFSVSLNAQAQGARALTSEDYAKAESWMSYNVSSLVDHTFGTPTFLTDGRFWYRDTSAASGVAFMLVDPEHGTKGAAFDQVKMAAALNAAMAGLTPPAGMASARKLEAKRLPITGFEFPDAKAPGCDCVAWGECEDAVRSVWLGGLYAC